MPFRQRLSAIDKQYDISVLTVSIVNTGGELPGRPDQTEGEGAKRKHFP